jgi:hypothetical protein
VAACPAAAAIRVEENRGSFILQIHSAKSADHLQYDQAITIAGEIKDIISSELGL